MSQPHEREHKTDKEWTEGKKASGVSEEKISESRAVWWEDYKPFFEDKTFIKDIFNETSQFSNKVTDISYKYSQS